MYRAAPSPISAMPSRKLASALPVFATPGKSLPTVHKVMAEGSGSKAACSKAAQAGGATSEVDKVFGVFRTFPNPESLRRARVEVDAERFALLATRARSQAPDRHVYEQQAGRDPADRDLAT